MAKPTRSTVFCVIRNAAASKLLAKAARAVDADVVMCDRKDYVDRSLKFEGLQALAYDLHPWNEEALEFFKKLRGERPYVPILVYAPPGPSVGECIKHAVESGASNVELQCGDDEECERLQAAVRDLVRSIPANRVLPAALQVLGDDVPDRVRAYVEEATLRTMLPDGVSSLRPKDLAAEAGTGLRTLERDLNKAGLPAPQELLDWIRLLMICFVSAQAGVTTGRVARRVGLTPNGLYRLRQRRLSPAQFAGSPADDELRTVLTHFAARCRNPTAVAESIFEELVA